MTTPSTTTIKTVDNLGFESSNRYARDQETIDPKMISDSRTVPLQTEVTTTQPSFQSKIEELLSFNKRNTPWAKFAPPQNYHSNQKSLFTFQLIPSMGSFEKQEANLDKISSMKKEEREEEKEEKEEGENKEKRKRATAKTLELQEEEKEIKIVTELLKKIGLLDKFIATINSKRGQYHKG